MVTAKGVDKIMKKKLALILTTIVILTVSIIGFAGCTPFTVKGYIEKAQKGDVTMTYEWNMSTGGVTKDIYEYDKTKFRRLSNVELVMEKRKDGNYGVYYQNYNVWFRSNDITEAEYLELIGDQAGEFVAGGQTQKQIGIKIVHNILSLAKENLEDNFVTEKKEYTLKKEHFDKVFVEAGVINTGKLAKIELSGGELIVSVKYGGNTITMTMSKLGSTKVKVTDDMRDGFTKPL